MLYRFYVIVGTFFFFFLRPLAPLARFAGERAAYGVEERFGIYPSSAPERDPQTTKIWIHAASVGEVQAAEHLIAELEKQGPYRFIITVMTWQGHRVAEKKLGSRATCLMAPLDAPFIVRRALKYIRPDLFVCVETELWPALLHELHGGGVRMCLINGRLSERSFGRYLKIKGLMQQLLAGFTAVSVIRAEDGRRFAGLGVAEERISVHGNGKYAYPPIDREQACQQYRKRLGLEDALIFISGSTRTGEEELLLPVFEQLRKESAGRLVWIIAPRHLERIAALKTFFNEQQLEVALFSQCGNAECTADILLVDCLGELADLYAAGDFNFCGGSLVDKGGHNIMEIVRWGLPVYFGSFMDDFYDAVQLVVPAGAGFQVSDAGELADLLGSHLKNRESYIQACRAAVDLSSQQGNAVKEQAALVRRVLEK